MYRAPFFTRTSLRRLSVRALAGAVVCVGAAAAHATTAADGLAISGSPPQQRHGRTDLLIHADNSQSEEAHRVVPDRG